MRWLRLAALGALSLGLAGWHIPEGSGGLMSPGTHSASGVPGASVTLGLAAQHTLLPGLVNSNAQSAFVLVSLARGFSLGLEIAPFTKVKGAALFGRWHFHAGELLWLAPFAGVQYLSGATGRVGEPESAGEESEIHEATIAAPALDVGIDASMPWRWFEPSIGYGYTATWLKGSRVQCVPGFWTKCLGEGLDARPLGGWDHQHTLTFGLRVGVRRFGVRVHLSVPLLAWFEPYFGLALDTTWP